MRMPLALIIYTAITKSCSFTRLRRLLLNTIGHTPVQASVLSGFDVVDLRLVHGIGLAKIGEIHECMFLNHKGA